MGCDYLRDLNSIRESLAFFVFILLCPFVHLIANAPLATATPTNGPPLVMSHPSSPDPPNPLFPPISDLPNKYYSWQITIPNGAPLPITTAEYCTLTMCHIYIYNVLWSFFIILLHHILTIPLASSFICLLVRCLSYTDNTSLDTKIDM